MGWSNWFSDPTGPGDVKEKTTSDADGTKSDHWLRTSDNAKEGSRNDHSHVIVTEKPGGSKSAHGHGIRGGKRK